jgi:hypothetical protein
MASRSKNKTTFAKLAREGRLRERRIEKQARKEARKRAAENPQTEPGDASMEEDADGVTERPSDEVTT